LTNLLGDLERDVRNLKRKHGGSRYLGPGADPAVARHVANGGSIEMGTGTPVDYADQFGGKSVGRVATRGGGFTDYRDGQQHAAPGEFAKAVMSIARRDTAHLAPAYSVKALAQGTDTAGGFLLPVEVSADVAMLIRARCAVLNLGPTIVEPTSKEYDLVGLATGGTATWLFENQAIPPSAQTFQIAAKLFPHAEAAMVAISNRLLAEASSDPSAETVIKSDLADVMAVTLDAALLSGTGTGGAPKGIVNYTGLTPGPTIPANGTEVSYPFLQSIPASLRNISSAFARPGWILHPRTLNSILSLTDSLGRPLIENSDLLSVDPAGSAGVLLGFPFRTSAQLPVNLTQGTATNASQIIFSSDWNEAFYGAWQALAIDASTEAAYTPDGGTTWISSFQNQQTLFRATTWCDFTLRRPERFVVVNGILP